MGTNDKPKRSLLARILSLEVTMAAFGLYSMVAGFMEGEVLQIFWGVIILAGLCILIAVRRRDWKKHWEGMESVWSERPRTTHPDSSDTNRVGK